MKRILVAASVAMGLGLGAAPLHVGPAAANDKIIVEVSPVASELARHLQVSPGSIPATVNLPAKIAAVVCNATLKQLRERGQSGGRCVAVSMSQGLIQAVRQELRGG